MNCQKCSEPDFQSFSEWSSCNSLLHILSTSSSKSGLNPNFVLRFLCAIELSLQSPAHFVDLIFQKWSEPVSSFYLKSSSRYSLVSCAFCRPLSPIERRTRGNKAPPAATTDGHFTQKKRKALCPRMFSNVNSRVPDRSHVPTTS